jgi:hypothetical protein
MGVIAMKVTGRGELIGQGSEKADAQQLIRYALSLPVALAVVGIGTVAQARQNGELARSFTPMRSEEMRKLASRISGANKTALDRLFASHIDS